MSCQLRGAIGSGSNSHVGHNSTSGPDFGGGANGSSGQGSDPGEPDGPASAGSSTSTAGRTVSAASGASATTGAGAAGPGASGSGGSASGATVAATDAASSGSGAGPSSAQSSGAGGANGCYTEAYFPNQSLSDLQNGYQQAQWLATMTTMLDRRYPNGHFILDAQKNDSWLTNDLPGIANMSAWSGMIDATDTACHEETHGYDFDQSLNQPGKHVYFLGQGQQFAPSELSFFARNEILAFVQQGGSVTQQYDDTYLTGEQGSYDFIFLGDELTAYTNELGCDTAIADQIQQQASYRDGVASELYYLQAYLHIARTNHAPLYAQWKADADWQKFVRFSWARGVYWTLHAKPFVNLGIADDAIWQRIDDPANLDEIKQFTGDDADYVACHP